MKKNEVKGIIILSLINFLKENYGEEGLERVLNQVSEETRKVFKGHIFLAASYSGDAFLEFQEKIVEIFGEGDLKFARKLGAFSARMSIKGPFKFIALLASVPWALRRGPLIFSKYYNIGKLVVEELDDKKRWGIIRIYELSIKARHFEERIAGWIEEIGKILKSPEAKAVIKKSVAEGDEYVEYEVSW